MLRFTTRLNQKTILEKVTGQTDVRHRSFKTQCSSFTALPGRSREQHPRSFISSLRPTFSKVIIIYSSGGAPRGSSLTKKIGRKPSDATIRAKRRTAVIFEHTVDHAIEESDDLLITGSIQLYTGELSHDTELKLIHLPL